MLVMPSAGVVVASWDGRGPLNVKSCELLLLPACAKSNPNPSSCGIRYMEKVCVYIRCDEGKSWGGGYMGREAKGD